MLCRWKEEEIPLLRDRRKEELAEMKEINVYKRTQKRNVRHMMYSSNVFTRIYKCKPDMTLPGAATRVVEKNYKVLQRTTPVLLCTTKYYASTTLFYKVLHQYYSVLQSTTPVLLCTTKVLLSTTQYHSVLPSTTTSYSSTTLYDKVLLQYYCVPQSTTPVLLCTTKYHTSTTLY